MVTKEQLASIFHSADKADLAEICEPLNAAMKEFGIDTPVRQAMFLAQCAPGCWCLTGRRSAA